ncbi:MAG: Uncharacterised protein [Hyphomonas sp. TMED17]|nr:MAG: Uncharacterised protein [Hyphomonas sp. TMED17]
MNQCHFGRKICQEQRFLDSGIAAGNHNHLLIPVEKAVTSCTGRNPEPLKMTFARQTKPFRLRPGRQDDTIGSVDCTALADSPHRTTFEINLVNMILGQLRTHFERVFLHFLH